MTRQEGSSEPKEETTPSAAPVSGSVPIRDAVQGALDTYFRQLNGDDGCGLYRLVLHEVEVPLLTSVMRYCNGNQTRAASLLGLNRATLRRKLRHYGLDDSGT